jgi:hypothetical protein
MRVTDSYDPERGDRAQQGFSPGQSVLRSCGLKAPPTPRTRSAIPTMCNTPVLQNSITPLTRIGGRGRRQLVRRSFLRSLVGSSVSERSRKNEALRERQMGIQNSTVNRNVTAQALPRLELTPGVGM